MSVYGEPIDATATTAFGLVCFLAGALVMLVLLRRRASADEHVSPSQDDQQWRLDSETDAYINGLAKEWAEREGRDDVHADIAGSYAKMSVLLQRRMDGTQ